MLLIFSKISLQASSTSHFRIRRTKPKLAKITSFNVTVDHAISASRATTHKIHGRSVFSQTSVSRDGKKSKLDPPRIVWLNHPPSTLAQTDWHANSAILRAKICPKIRWAIFREMGMRLVLCCSPKIVNCVSFLHNLLNHNDENETILLQFQFSFHVHHQFHNQRSFWKLMRNRDKRPFGMWIDKALINKDGKRFRSRSYGVVTDTLACRLRASEWCRVYIIASNCHIGRLLYDNGENETGGRQAIFIALLIAH